MSELPTPVKETNFCLKYNRLKRPTTMTLIKSTNFIKVFTSLQYLYELQLYDVYNYVVIYFFGRIINYFIHLFICFYSNLCSIVC